MTSTLPQPPEAPAADATFVPPPAPVVAAPFEQLGLAAPVLANLARLGYHQMTPIQAASLPVALAGNDLIAQAKTGSGKTAAFGLTLLANLNPRRFAVQTLLLPRDGQWSVLMPLRLPAAVASTNTEDLKSAVTTLLNSSATARWGASAISRARLARNCSPLESTLYGRSHEGTLPRPTLESAAAAASKSPSGQMASMMGASPGHSGAYSGVPPHRARPRLVLPLPLGPTMTPICHGALSTSSWASMLKLAPLSTLNSDFTRSAR